jgi:hypothetical protein
MIRRITGLLLCLVGAVGLGGCGGGVTSTTSSGVITPSSSKVTIYQATSNTASGATANTTDLTSSVDSALQGNNKNVTVKVVEALPGTGGNPDVTVSDYLDQSQKTGLKSSVNVLWTASTSNQAPTPGTGVTNANAGKLVFTQTSSAVVPGAVTYTLPAQVNEDPYNPAAPLDTFAVLILPDDPTQSPQVYVYHLQLVVYVSPATAGIPENLSTAANPALYNATFHASVPGDNVKPIGSQVTWSSNPSLPTTATTPPTGLLANLTASAADPNPVQITPPPVAQSVTSQTLTITATSNTQSVFTAFSTQNASATLTTGGSGITIKAN